MGNIEDKQVHRSRRTKGKQRCRTSTSYEKDTNKFLTIIYHNIKRLQDEKKGIERSGSVAHQLKLCGTTPERRISLENRDVRKLDRAHFYLPQHSCGSQLFKRKVTFSNPVANWNIWTNWSIWKASEDTLLCRVRQCSVLTVLKHAEFKIQPSFVHWNALLTFHENVLHYHFKLTRTAVALYRPIIWMHWIFSSIPFTILKLFTVQFFVQDVKKSLLRHGYLKIIYQLSLVSPDRFLVV